MKTENYRLKPIISVNDMNFFLDLCEKKYGKIIDISLPEINEERIKDIKYLMGKVNNISKIKLTIISSNREATSINVDTKNWNMEVKTADMKETKIEQEEFVEEKQTFEQAISDPNYIYYKFDNGLIARYDNKGMYYRLTKSNEWVNDQNILSWIVGSEYDYEIINRTSEKGVSKL